MEKEDNKRKFNKAPLILIIVVVGINALLTLNANNKRDINKDKTENSMTESSINKSSDNNNTNSSNVEDTKQHENSVQYSDDENTYEIYYNEEEQKEYKITTDQDNNVTTEEYFPEPGDGCEENFTEEEFDTDISTEESLTEEETHE